MRRRSVVALACLVAAQGARAEVQGDPTFNGLVAQATCYVRTVTACQSGSCTQVVRGCPGDLCGTLNLFMKLRQFRFDSSESEPLQITGIAPAEVGKPLWVKFLLPMKQGTGEGRLTLQPDRTGGYAGSAVTYKADADDPTGRSFVLIDYDCQQTPDGP